eukprot:TRINITY_DN51478_c0_g1_i1.p1 TRINITY_DN51478_c0_g1~~TRINITY_DN51478_c0_g1_i1.p1  ORF type:complete len:234 (+),score=28.82 TRINITY_DN51478_c0_g1_i1:182-883(+)
MLMGDPAKQWEWHETYRDMMKNHYRTTYSDMAHGRETYCKSDFPSGYGGHIPAIRHDQLFRNTAFDRNRTLMRSDPSRDAFPSFIDQIAGLPTITKQPCGARKNPTKGVVPHDGTTTMLKPPWGIMTGRREALNYRSVPATMLRSSSLPSLTRDGGSTNVNAPAMGNSRSQAGGGAKSFLDESTMSEVGVSEIVSPDAARMKRSVQIANETAQYSRMPNESEILAENLNPSRT